MRNRKGEIATILTIGTLVVIGVTAVISSLGLNKKQTIGSKASTYTCGDHGYKCVFTDGEIVQNKSTFCTEAGSYSGYSGYTCPPSNICCIPKVIANTPTPYVACSVKTCTGGLGEQYWVKSGKNYEDSKCTQPMVGSVTDYCKGNSPTAKPTAGTTNSCTGTSKEYTGTVGTNSCASTNALCNATTGAYANKQWNVGSVIHCCCTPPAPTKPPEGKGCGSGGGWACDASKGYDTSVCKEPNLEFNCCYQNGNRYGCVGTYCSSIGGVNPIVPCSTIAQPTQPAGGGATPTGNPQDKGDACCIAYRPDMYGCGGGTNKIVYYSHSMSTYGMTSCEKYNKDTSTMLYFTCKDGTYTEGQCVSVWNGGLSIDDKNNAINNLYPTAVPEDPTPQPAAGCQSALNGAECRYIDDDDTNNTYTFSNGQCCPKAVVVAPTAGAAGAGCNPGKTATCTDKVTTYTYYKSKSTTCSAGTELNKPCYGISSTSCEAYTWGELAGNKCNGTALPETKACTPLTHSCGKGTANEGETISYFKSTDANCGTKCYGKTDTSCKAYSQPDITAFYCGGGNAGGGAVTPLTCEYTDGHKITLAAVTTTKTECTSNTQYSCSADAAGKLTKTEKKCDAGWSCGTGADSGKCVAQATNTCASYFNGKGICAFNKSNKYPHGCDWFMHGAGASAPNEYCIAKGYESCCDSGDQPDLSDSTDPIVDPKDQTCRTNTGYANSHYVTFLNGCQIFEEEDANKCCILKQEIFVIINNNCQKSATMNVTNVAYQTIGAGDQGFVTLKPGQVVAMKVDGVGAWTYFSYASIKQANSKLEFGGTYCN